LFHSNYGGVYYPYAQPLLPYPLYVPTTQELTTPPPSAAPQNLSYENHQDLAPEVQRLSQEVERLRSEQSALVNVPAPAFAPSPAPVPRNVSKSRVLVFRDGHRLAFQNYALTQDAVLIMDDGAPTKVLLSELDLPATEQANLGHRLRLSPSSK
jgi:hypothetical protein